LQALRWVVFGVFAFVFTAFALANAMTVVTAARERRSVSLIVLIGGASGALAAFIAPIPGLWAWFWLPLTLDIGTSLFLGAGLVGGVRRLRRHR